MSPKKTLVLGTLLLVPVLAFLFLMMFGTNKFALQTYLPVSVDSTRVEGQWRYDTTYFQVPDFQLISQTGASFSQKDLQGSLYVAQFFHTACQNTCRQVSTQLARVQDAFRLKPEVRLLSFSVQPLQDSVAVLQEYAKSFKANPEKWHFLTGPPAQIQKVVQTGFLLPANGAMQDTSLVGLQQRLLLIDEQKHVRGIYDGTDANEIDRLITEINVLLSEDKPEHGK